MFFLLLIQQLDTDQLHPTDVQIVFLRSYYSIIIDTMPLWTKRLADEENDEEETESTAKQW